MIFMYYTFRSENDHKSGNIPTYANKLAVSNVIELVNQNHLQVEAFKTIVNDAFERQFNLIHSQKQTWTYLHNNRTMKHMINKVNNLKILILIFTM